MAVTVTSPSAIKIQVGPGSPPTATSVSYGKKFYIADAGDFSAGNNPQTGYVIAYNLSTSSFFLEAAPIAPEIDNGYF